MVFNEKAQGIQYNTIQKRLLHEIEVLQGNN